ncbi:sterol desaturase family protein [Ignavibacterium sp.]|uniref:sterol desaturase family protein n=1 Tax=Ignavibacterium sp. TaxID=2651167 RepID=UPI00307F7534
MPKNFVSNKDETVRMFKNDFLEALSRVHPSVPLIIYLPVVIYVLYISAADYSFSFFTIAGLFVFGLFIWTITEYVLHKFVFHFKPKSQLGEKLHFIFHGVHHDYPSDSRRLVMPPSVSVPLALLFFFLFQFLIGNSYVYPFFAGFLVGYLFYDLTHYAIHHFNMHSKIWLEIKNHHMRHHYLDPNKGFGVSSPIWDIIFGTNFRLKKEEQKAN